MNTKYLSPLKVRTEMTNDGDLSESDELILLIGRECELWNMFRECSRDKDDENNEGVVYVKRFNLT